MSHPQVDVRFDHTIIAARDKHESARFFTGIFGLPEPQGAGFFVAVHLTDGRVLDFVEPPVDFPGPVLDATGSWGLGVVETDDEAELRAFAAGDPVVTTGTGTVELGKMLGGFIRPRPDN
jgi:catechol 2,3-dioxygenase-like lactoylglutathione lyase family enzyme